MRNAECGKEHQSLVTSAGTTTAPAVARPLISPPTHPLATHLVRWWGWTAPARAPAFREGVKALRTRTVKIEAVQGLPVNDQPASAQFDERVLGQKMEASFPVPDEEFEQFVVVNVSI